MTLTGTIFGLYVGQPANRWTDRAPSAIGKSLLQGAAQVTVTGIVGDLQADLAVHGGPDKALHMYPSEHYAEWQSRFPGHADIFQPGAFGENIASTGLTEDNVHIGDIFEVGSTLIQVSHGRQPCWKLNMHTGIDAMAPAFQKTGKTGWYFRVLRKGIFASGDAITLAERPCPGWPLAEVIKARFDPRLDPEIANQLSILSPLAENWREAFTKKRDPDFVENTDRRLKGA